MNIQMAQLMEIPENSCEKVDTFDDAYWLRYFVGCFITGMYSGHNSGFTVEGNIKAAQEYLAEIKRVESEKK